MSAPARKLVAVVDDDPRILESLQDLLESAGYDVVAHASGGTLLANDVTRIDCLITDIGMPGMDGFELRDQVKRLRPGLPVILVSGRRDLTDAEQAGQGSAEFFRKPFDGAALLAAIDKALRGGG
jgi:FixJ family two-component response regulator